MCLVNDNDGNTCNMEFNLFIALGNRSIPFVDHGLYLSIYVRNSSYLLIDSNTNTVHYQLEAMALIDTTIR